MSPQFVTYSKTMAGEDSSYPLDIFLAEIEDALRVLHNDFDAFLWIAVHDCFSLILQTSVRLIKLLLMRWLYFNVQMWYCDLEVIM